MTRSRLPTQEMDSSAGKGEHESFERLLREGNLRIARAIQAEEKTIGGAVK